MTNMRLHLCGQATIYCLLAGPSGGFLFKPTPTFTHSISENIFRGISSSPKRRNSRTNSSSKFDVPRAVASARMSTSKHLGKLLPPSTVFFACDIQERFRDIILNMPSVISTARFMLDVSETLGVPCLVTEQYPKALLHTVQELSVGPDGERKNVPVFEKKMFSMCTPEVMAHLNTLPKKPTDVVLFGIEAHVCVTQTCLDLLDHGYGVHIVCDGVSSQKPYDRTIGLQRMQQVGAFMTTAEQVAFQLAQSSEHPQFKAISKLAKGRNEEGNAFSSMTTL